MFQDRGELLRTLLGGGLIPELMPITLNNLKNMFPESEETQESLKKLYSSTRTLIEVGHAQSGLDVRYRMENTEWNHNQREAHIKTRDSELICLLWGSSCQDKEDCISIRTENDPGGMMVFLTKDGKVTTNVIDTGALDRLSTDASLKVDLLIKFNEAIASGDFQNSHYPTVTS